MQQFAEAVSERGDFVEVVAARRSGVPAIEARGNVVVHRIQDRMNEAGGRGTFLVKNLTFFLRALVFLAKQHLKEPYDVIHVQAVPDSLVFCAVVPKLLGAKVVLDLRDVIPELYASKFGRSEKSVVFKLLKAAERASAAFADHVIVANPIWFERIVQRSARRAKCSMIWYSPDPKLFYPRPAAKPEGKFVMMYPGTLSWHQGVDIAVRALPKIAAEIPGAELHIYAEGKDREVLGELAERLDVGERVRFFDCVPTAELAERMARCDVAVVPKRASDRFGNEAASTKIPEFVAMGVPVVASRTDIESQFFDDSQLWYFRSEDENDLARTVVSVYHDAEAREQRSRNALQAIEGGALAPREQYRDLIDSLLARKERAAKQGERSPAAEPPNDPRRLTPKGADSFYTLKPLIPRWLQIKVRRQFVRRRYEVHEKNWPVCESAGMAPPSWPGWPGGKRFALVLTHDVESAAGLPQCERLADLEQDRGFRSVFGFVPLRYETPERLRSELASRGFEIMVHDLYHDGKLFRTRAMFERRRGQINEYLRQWQTRGFCSGAMHHNLPWISELEIDYDVSTYDVDPFEPQACGTGRIFPCWVQSPDEAGRGFLELPYTLPQDFTLFALLRERDNSLWRTKLDWIAAKGGMALIKTHPDYMSFGTDGKRMDRYPAQLYAGLLDYVWERYAEKAWVAHPSEVARYWRGLREPEAGSENRIPAAPTLCPNCRRAHAAGWVSHYPSIPATLQSG